MTRPPAGRLTVLIAPDSFKGSLTAVDVARALAAGWSRARPDDEVLLAPLADGGEGTLVAIAEAGGWSWQETDATDPIGRPVRARWLRSADGSTAVVELAEASGLSRLSPDEHDPIGASTFGTGQVLRAALDAGVRRITLGIGGSATTDGAKGILLALAGRRDGEAFSPAELDERLREVDLRIACDVTNPLLGPAGAAATYGPQKGATPAQIEALERRLERWARQLNDQTESDETRTPGAGAAGGTGFGLLSVEPWLRSVELVPGVDLVMDAVDIDGKLARTDLVITGEGRIDDQTAFGKTALGVARRAHDRGLPTIAVGGGVTPEGIEALAALDVVCVPVVEEPQAVEEAMSAGAAPVERAGERIGRLVSLLPSAVQAGVAEVPG